MKGEWCYFKSHISLNICNQIIQDAHSIPSSDGAVGLANEGIHDQNIRRSKVKFIHASDSKFNYLFDILWKTALEANRSFFDIHFTKLDFCQFTEYDESYQGEYKEHHDVFWLNNDPYLHRKLSCVVQLSSPKEYEGGNFEITDCTTPLDKDSKEQGSIIYFPSMLRHKVTPVTKGKRYSLVAWFEGPKWR
jgi:PKHD-type hydroxylase